MTINKLLSSISRREWRLVFFAVGVAVVMTSLPPLYGWLKGMLNDTPWTGLQIWAPGDFSVYISLINQARDGALLGVNRFTTAETVPAFNVLWWSIGRFAALFSLNSVAAFYISRTLLIPVLGVATYVSVSYFFKQVRRRAIAFLLLFFSSGIGVFFYPFFRPLAIGKDVYEVPIDMLMSEAHLFASMTYSPHFVASWIFLLLSALFLLMAFDNRQTFYGMLSGACALVLFQFHPYHAPTLFMLGGLYLLVGLIVRRKDWWKQLWVFGVFIFISSPSLIYHYLTMTSDAMGREIVASSYTPTPHPIHLLIGFGVFSVLAPIGFYLWCKSRRKISALIFLTAWGFSALVLSYAGFVFERRLLEGVFFSLVILSLPAIMFGLKWLKRRFPHKLTYCAVVALIIVYLFIPTSITILYRQFNLYADNTYGLAYFTRSEADTLRWIKDNTPPGAAFYGTQLSGNKIVGWAERWTYFGHWVNSGRPDERMKEAKDFFQNYAGAERAQFMQERGLEYLYYSSYEKNLGEVREDDFFRRIFQTGDIEIFQLR